MKIKRAEGWGQGQCALCAKRGKWNRQWMTFLYEVEGKDGVYCEKCVKAMKIEEWRKEHGLSDANNSEDQ